MQNVAELNPFAAPATQKQGAGALVEIEQQRAIAETQAAIMLAKKFPRDQRQAMDNILTACSRQTLAESALYSYSRGGAEVTGPSIRLAEALAQNWGNINFGIRELEQRNGESTVEAFAWDMQTNTKQVKIFQVPHLRYTKNGSKRLEDPRDIYEMVANQGARRLRACILGVIPGDVVEAATRQCELTLETKFDITPDYIKSIMAAFAKWGVSQEMIEKRIQRRMEALTPALAVGLSKILNSLKDGMGKPADFFEGVAATAGEYTGPDITKELEQIRNAATLEALAKVFGSAWKKVTDNAARAQLTLAKDKRKDELQPPVEDVPEAPPADGEGDDFLASYAETEARQHAHSEE